MLHHAERRALVLSLLILTCASLSCDRPPDDPASSPPDATRQLDVGRSLAERPTPPTAPPTPPTPTLDPSPITTASVIAASAGASHAPIEHHVATGLTTRPLNPTCRAPSRPPTLSDIPLKVTQVFEHLDLAWGIEIIQTPWSDDHWWVIERAGRVLEITGEHYQLPEGYKATVKKKKARKKPPPPLPADVPETREILDVSEDIYNSAMDAGLLGLAFHPRFEETREVFLYYTIRFRPKGKKDRQLYTQLVRMKAGADGTLDRATEEVMIRVEQPGREHNGGHIEFGPDGYLYIGLGDGHIHAAKNAQRPHLLLGKLLRIDVDGGGEDAPYGIPPDNPFINDPETRPEIFALGLRNPWRFSIDAPTGDIWAGDVGDAKMEEVDLIRAGGNYGWPVFEGTNCFWRSKCKEPGYIPPIVEYSHEEGRAVTGGVVYRGDDIPALVGKFLFADFGSGVFWGVFNDPKTGAPERREILDTRLNPASFAQSRQGKVYVVHYSSETGHIYRLDPAQPPPPSTFPLKLSETGCVDPKNPERPLPAMIPYTLTDPFWSDGAFKERFLAIPDGTTIDVEEDGDWSLPVGSVTLKNFWLNQRIIETRLYVRHDDGEWAGYSYAWDEAQTDATLLKASEARDIEGQRWLYPTRAQCQLCHTTAAGRTLGLETALLNSDYKYPGARVANQLRTLDHIGLFSQPLNDPATLPTIAPLADTTLSLEQRARDYLHLNCASCHRPNGTGRATMDMRREVPFNQMGLCDAEANISPLELKDPRLLAPGEPGRSLIFSRMSRRDVHSMPPMGSLIVDRSGAMLIREWIESIKACPPKPKKKRRRRKKR